MAAILAPFDPVRTLPADVTPASLRAMVSIDGGEPIDWDAEQRPAKADPGLFPWAAPWSMLLAYTLLIGRLWAERRRSCRQAA